MDEKIHVLKNILTKVQFGDVLISFSQLQTTPRHLSPVPISELHKHPFYEFRFATKGNFVISTVNQEVCLPIGEMLVLCPETYHYSYIPRDDVETVVLSLFIDRVECCEEEPKIFDTFYRILQEANLKTFVPTEALLRKSKEYLALSFASQEDTRTHFQAQILGSQIILELFDLFRVYDTPSAESASTVPGKIAPDLSVALDFFVHAPEISLSEIAEELGYSEKHISRRIKQVYGTTLTQLRKQYKLNKAKTLLAEHPELDIQQVSNIIGFQSISLFYSFFRKAEGCSPKEYRNRFLLKNESDPSASK